MCWYSISFYPVVQNNFSFLKSFSNAKKWILTISNYSYFNNGILKWSRTVFTVITFIKCEDKNETNFRESKSHCYFLKYCVFNKKINMFIQYIENMVQWNPFKSLLGEIKVSFILIIIVHLITIYLYLILLTT